MTPTNSVYEIFDAATKVNSPWALGAFGIAAVVAIIFLFLHYGAVANVRDSAATRKLRRKAAPGANWEYDEEESDTAFAVRPAHKLLPPARPVVSRLAWIVLIVAIVVPFAAYAYVQKHSDLPYKFKVVVLDRDRGLIPVPHVVCAVPGCELQGIVDSAVQFDLAPQNVPGDNSVTFFADSNNSHGQKSVTLTASRSVPVQVDIVSVPAPVVPIQPATKPATPAAKNPISAGNAVDKFWLGDYTTGWRKTDSAEVIDTKPETVVRSWSGEERNSISIEQANRIVMTFERRLSTPPNSTLCNAVWTGLVSRGNPGTVNFQVSRDGQGDYFCDVPMVMSLNGTIRRIGEHGSSVQSSFEPWHRVDVQMRGAN